ncbi:hypothetical protein JCM11491_003815 [Sporobolomyces phaffii]
MATKPLNIDTKRLPATPQWSPILSHWALSSPRSATSAAADLDLSSRCRKLARSFGESALSDDFEHSSGSSSPQQQPRSRENSSDSLAASPLSASGGRHHHLPLSPPLATPEGSHVLNEILEEENESTPQTEAAQDEKGLGFSSVEDDHEPEPIHFKLSPLMGSQLSLHGASLAMEDMGQMPEEGARESALGLSLHERMKLDLEDYQFETLLGESVEDYERALRDQLKSNQSWIGIDVSLVDGELLVGNPSSQLDPAQTFSACYVDPLLDILSEASSTSPTRLFASHDRRLSSPSGSPSPSPSRAQPHPSPHLAHVPTTSSPLHLALTLHTPAPLTLQYLQASLQPLHDQHFLTSYCPNARLTSKAPIVVLVTGDSVSDRDVERHLETPRIVYRFPTFAEIEREEGRSTPYNAQSHPVVTVDLPGSVSADAATRLSQDTKSEVADQVKRAHARAFSVAVRGVPKFPEHVRNSIETELKSIGVDHIP